MVFCSCLPCVWFWQHPSTPCLRLQSNCQGCLFHQNQRTHKKGTGSPVSGTNYHSKRGARQKDRCVRFLDRRQVRRLRQLHQILLSEKAVQADLRGRGRRQSPLRPGNQLQFRGRTAEKYQAEMYRQERRLDEGQI